MAKVSTFISQEAHLALTEQETYDLQRLCEYGLDKIMWEHVTHTIPMERLTELFCKLRNELSKSVDTMNKVRKAASGITQSPC